MKLREQTNLLTRVFQALFTNHEGTIMTATKTPNYTDEMVARMEAVYTEATTDEQRKNAVIVLANELGKAPASVIAKLVNMGIYVKGSIERATKPKPDTKAVIAQRVADRLHITNEVLVKGLAKADRNALVALETALDEQ
jgi:peptidoglycan hydrolase-like amidase